MKGLDEKTLTYLKENGMISESDILKLKGDKGVQTPSLLDSFNSYITHLKATVSDNTVAGYKANLIKFMEFYFGVPFSKVNKDTPVPLISSESIIKWFKTLFDEGYSYDTLRRFKHSLKRYLDYIKSQYKLPVPNLDTVELPTDAEETEILAYRDEVIREMLDYTESKRDKAIVLFAYETGMKRQELIDCETDDINFQNGQVKIRNKAGRVERVAIISKQCIGLIKDYISAWEMEISDINDKRREYEKTKGRPYVELIRSKYLFQTIKSPQINYSTIHNMVKAIALEFFANKNMKKGVSETDAIKSAKDEAEQFTLETLRQSKRAYLFAQGKTVDQVQVIMGDENKWLCKRYMQVAQRLYPEKF